MSVPAASGDLAGPHPRARVRTLVYQFPSLPPPCFFPPSLPPFSLPNKHFLPFYEHQNYPEGATFLLESSDRTSWSLCAHLPQGHFHGTDTKYLLRAQCPIRTLEIPDLAFLVRELAGSWGHMPSHH